MIRVLCYQCPDRRVGCHDPEACREWAKYLSASSRASEAKTAAIQEIVAMDECDGGILGGVHIYDTEEQAAEAWNRRAENG